MQVLCEGRQENVGTSGLIWMSLEAKSEIVDITEAGDYGIASYMDHLDCFHGSC